MGLKYFQIIFAYLNLLRSSASRKCTIYNILPNFVYKFFLITGFHCEYVILCKFAIFGAYLFKDGLLNEIEEMKDEFLNTKQYLKVKNQQNSPFYISYTSQSCS